jgi:hypothetical protein
MTERIEVVEQLGLEFARVAAEVEQSSRSRAVSRARIGLRVRALALATGVTALLCGTAYAVPSTRTAFSEFTGSFSSWILGGGDEAPGRALSPSADLPGWWFERSGARLIAETGGARLFAVSTEGDAGPMLEFSLGTGHGIADTLEGWQRRLEGHNVSVLGSALFEDGGFLDDDGRAPLMGLSTTAVRRLELRYLDGAPLIGDVGDGGFVLLVEPWRRMRELLAFDASGHLLERANLSDRDLSYLCEKEPGCPPRP